MKKQFISLCLCIAMLLLIPVLLPTKAEASESDIVEAGSFEALRTALERADDTTVILTGNISLDLDPQRDDRLHYEYTADGDLAGSAYLIYVHGTHRLDLAGHDIRVSVGYTQAYNDPSEYKEKNLTHSMATFLFDLENTKDWDGPTRLTVDDSKGGGEVTMRSDVPSSYDFGKEKVRFYNIGYRTIFLTEDDSELIINGGSFSAGNSEKWKIHTWHVPDTWFSLGGRIASVASSSSLTVNGGNFFCIGKENGHDCYAIATSADSHVLINDGYFECKQCSLFRKHDNYFYDNPDDYDECINFGEFRYTHYDKVYFYSDNDGFCHSIEGYRAYIGYDIDRIRTTDPISAKKFSFNGKAYATIPELHGVAGGEEERSDCTLKIEPADSQDGRITFSSDNGMGAAGLGVRYGYVRGEDMYLYLSRDGLLEYTDPRYDFAATSFPPLRYAATTVTIHGASQKTGQTADLEYTYDQGNIKFINLNKINELLVWTGGDFKDVSLRFLDDWVYSLDIAYTFEWTGYHTWTYTVSSESPFLFVTSTRAYPINCLDGMKCAVSEAVPGTIVNVYYAGDRIGTLNEVKIKPDIPIGFGHDMIVGDVYWFTMPDCPVTVSADITRNTYRISAAKTEHGRIDIADSTVLASGATTITVTPDEGYEVVSVNSITTSNVLEKVSSTKYTLTVFSDDTISAEFARKTCTVSFYNADKNKVAHTETSNSGAISLNVTGPDFYKSYEYVHDGWSTTSSGPLAYHLSDTYTGSKDLTLYPHYTQISAENGTYEITGFHAPKCQEYLSTFLYPAPKVYVDDQRDEAFRVTYEIYRVDPATGTATLMDTNVGAQYSPAYRYYYVFKLELYDGCKTQEYSFPALPGRINGVTNYVAKTEYGYNSSLGIYDRVTITTKEFTPLANELSQAKVMIKAIENIGAPVKPMIEAGAYNYPNDTTVSVVSNTYTVDGEAIETFECLRPTTQTIVLQAGAGCTFTPATKPVTPMDYVPGYSVSGRYLSPERYEVTVTHRAWALSQHNITVYGGYSYEPRASAGTEVTVFTNDTDFMMWQANGVELSVDQMKSDHMTFIMPENDVTLTAVIGGADSHMKGELLRSTPATCTRSGSEVYACAYAGHDDQITVTIPARGHLLTAVSKIPATCISTGISCDCWYCMRCGEYFADAAGKTKIDSPVTAIDPSNHPSAVYHYDDDCHWQECGYCNTVIGSTAAHDFCLDVYDEDTGELNPDAKACKDCGCVQDCSILRSVRLVNGSGTAVNRIPDGNFSVEMQFGSEVPDGILNMFISVYDADGQMLSVQHRLLGSGDSGKLKNFSISNTSGRAALVKVIFAENSITLQPSRSAYRFSK